MLESQIFNGLDDIERYQFFCTTKFNYLFGKLKNSDKDFILEVDGFAFYNTLSPTAKTNCFRYYLELNIKNSTCENKPLVVIMLNPSNTLPKDDKNLKLDTTVKNAVRIAYKAGYSKVIIINSFNYIDGNSQTALKFENNCIDINSTILNNVIKEYREILFAWGNGVKQFDKNRILSLVKSKFFDLKIKMYSYAWNQEKDYPYHLAMRVNNKNTNFPITKFLLGDGNLIKLMIQTKLKSKKGDLVARESLVFLNDKI